MANTQVNTDRPMRIELSDLVSAPARWPASSTRPTASMPAGTGDRFCIQGYDNGR